MARTTYYLPTATALAVSLFVPARHSANRKGDGEILAIEYLDYGVIGGVQITSLARHPIAVTSVLINGEFTSSLCAPRETTGRAYLQQGFPRCLREYGDSFITITDAPAAPDAVRALCYGKPVSQVFISTDHGDFAYEISGK